MNRIGSYVIPVDRIEGAIVEVRGKRVVLGPVLARLYGVSTRRLNEQVRRNVARFPDDFMFQLTWDEVAALKSKLVSASSGVSLRSQNATLKRGQHVKYLPYAFTEHGAVMAATVLNSQRAIEISVFVVRAFVRMRQVLATHRELALKLAELESKVTMHDKHIAILFAAIRDLMTPPTPGKQPIGFRPAEPGGAGPTGRKR